MPNYVTKALKNFKHKLQKNQHQPYPSAPIIYGSKKQYATPTTTAPFLDSEDKKFIQQVCGRFPFLGIAVDRNLLCPISAIASQSATPTEDTMQHTQQFMGYIATHEEAVLTFNASDMELASLCAANFMSLALNVRKVSSCVAM